MANSEYSVAESLRVVIGGGNESLTALLNSDANDLHFLSEFGADVVKAAVKMGMYVLNHIVYYHRFPDYLEQRMQLNMACAADAEEWERLPVKVEINAGLLL